MQASIDQELRDLEARYWEAARKKDDAVATALSDERCVVVGAHGIDELDRERLGQMLKQASYDLTRYEFADQTFIVRKITEDVAIVAYEVREDLVVDGKPESLAAFDASVWVHRGDRWVCALHTETLRGDPFGREQRDLVHPEAIKQVVRELVTAQRAFDIPRVRELLAPDLTWYHGSSGKPLGREDLLRIIEEDRHAFSDLDIRIEQLIAEGTFVSARLLVTARHTGTFQGIAPTNRQLRFTSVWTLRVAGGRVAQIWMVDEDFVAKLQAA